ncbi:MAG: hypothetical protein FVQ79_00975, partial [Planctomycetes bacterium]|nr:hypothetical protein [Planctomycetota bacterium]
MSGIPGKCFIIIRLWRAIGLRLRRMYYLLLLGRMGRGTSITSNVFIDHPYNVFIDEDVVVNQFALIQAGPESTVTIGSGTHISFRATILTASLELSKGHVSEAHNSRSVVIEDNVWIAVGATICPGVKLGRTSVI